MAEFSSLNGYDVKDKIARENISINTDSIDKLNGMVSGALINVENGVDITDSFKDAYNSLDNETGGTIYIKSGEYIIRPLRIGNFVDNEPNTHNIEHLPDVKPLRIIGLGDVTLKLADHSNGDMFLFGSHDKGLYFENIIFDGNKDNQTFGDGDISFWTNYQASVLMFRCENVRFYNCTFKNAKSFGLNASKDCYNVEIKDCKALNCECGMDFIVHDCVIDNVHISDCSKGLFFESVERVDVDFNNLVGINSNIVIKNSKIDCDSSIRTTHGCYNMNVDNVEGIQLLFDSSACSGIGFKKLKVHNSDFKRLYVARVSDLSIKNNMVDATNYLNGDTVLDSYVMYVDRSKKGYISNNVITSLDDKMGICLNNNEGENIYISENIINVDTNFGVKFNNGGKNHFVNGNIITSNNEYAVCLHGTPTGIHIMNNVLSSTNRGIVQTHNGTTYSMVGNIGDDYSSPTINNYMRIFNVAELPTASEEYKNMVVIVNQVNGSRDGIPYVCVFTKDRIYEWRQLCS